MRHPGLTAAIVVGLLMGFAGCSSDGSDSSGGSGDKITRYVALGDSAVSGPKLEPMDPEAPPECFRSLRNYPQEVAAELGAAVVDVSCGGATTDDVRQTVKQGRTQLDALKSNTQIVTVGIGANDAGLASGWFKTCFLPGQSDQACAAFMASYAPNLLSQTRGRVIDLLKEIKVRSPNAEVLLVGYLRFAPSEGSCDELPISQANRAASEAFERDLAAMLRDAATEAKVGFVDMWSVAKGHDICAGSKAWVNGLSPHDGDLLHPTSAGMKAVAAEVVRVIRGK